MLRMQPNIHDRTSTLTIKVALILLIACVKIVNSFCIIIVLHVSREPTSPAITYKMPYVSASVVEVHVLVCCRSSEHNYINGG